jgi:putative glutathione S-transferase
MTLPTATTTATTGGPRYASPVDTATFGEYKIVRDPHDPRPLYRFEGRISTDGSTPFRAEPGRYHLYSGWFCPWAQRIVITRSLAGLEGIISLSYVHGERDGRGWGFREPTGPDPVNGFTLLRDGYDATEARFDGHVSVPTLWDRTRGVVVSNQFRTMGIDLATRFRHLATPVVATYPARLAGEIEELDAWLGPAVNHGAHVAGGTGEAAREARGTLRRAFADLDHHLASSRYLLGNVLTEADVRLWVTLVRFDVGPNVRREIVDGLHDYPNLWAYARDLYAVPAFRHSTDFASFSRPGATPADWDEPAHRGADRSTSAA